VAGLSATQTRHAGRNGNENKAGRQLPKLYVEGSIPFARSKFLSRPVINDGALYRDRHGTAD